MTIYLHDTGSHTSIYIYTTEGKDRETSEGILLHRTPYSPQNNVLTQLSFIKLQVYIYIYIYTYIYQLLTANMCFHIKANKLLNDNIHRPNATSL
jgi:hypothetical protein